MERSHLLGEFLVKNGMITTQQLLNALEFQRDSLKILNLMGIMERNLEQEDIEQIMQRQLEAGESLEEAAISLGLMTREQLEQKSCVDHAQRIPMGKILVKQQVVDEPTMEEWVRLFENQDFDASNQLPLLRKVPLFEQLDEECLLDVANRLQFKHYDGGELVFGEEDSSDAIFLIESGLVKMSLSTKDGLHELGTFSSNMHFGLNGILDGRPRGQRAEAIMNSTLWKLGREDFREILRKYPEVSFAALGHMSTGLSNVFRTIKGDKSVLKTNIVSIFVEEDSPRSIELARDLIREIFACHHHPVQVLYTPGNLSLPLKADPQSLNIEARNAQKSSFYCLHNPGLEEVDDFEWLVKWLHQESRSIHTLVVVARAGSRSGLSKMLLESSARTLTILEKTVPSDLLTQIEAGRDRIYLLPDGTPRESYVYAVFEKLEENARLYMPQLLQSHQLRFSDEHTTDAAQHLARWLSGTTLGVAFGGGGARVMAHLGFLEMLEAEGVPIDEVAGSSGGAVVAGMLATGMKTAGIIEFFKKNAILARKNPLVDLTIPIKSMARGRRFEKLLKKGFGRRQIYDTSMPYFPVSTDMSTGMEYIARMSPMWKAAKGSAAIPGFHPIVKLNGRLLGDGGILNNVPASVLRNFGSGSVISLNITPDPSGSKLNPDRMLSALVQGVDIMLFQSVEQHLKYTDIESKPNVDGYGTADFAAGLELLERGREEAQRHKRKLQQLVESMQEKRF